MDIATHATSSFPLEHHFRGRRDRMRPLFDHLVAALARELDFEYKIGKTYIGLIHTLVFAAIRVQTEKLVLEFVIRQQVASPRITRVRHFQRQRWAYFVDIRDAGDIDAQLIEWVALAHE
jgi:hypothetical protein